MRLASDKSAERIDDMNAIAWDLLAEQHQCAGSYESLLQMKPIDVLGDWALRWAESSGSKTVCHIACHLGLEAIAWAKAGYYCIGVDRSAIALRGAKKYASQVGIQQVEWCLADIGKELPIRSESIDLVWLSHGSIYWYPEIRPLLNRIVRLLRPGGVLLIEEIHPISLIVSTLQCPKHPTLQRYSFDGKPIGKEVKMQYAGGSLPCPAHIWVHSLGDVVSGAVSSGLVIIELKELGWTKFKQFPFLMEHVRNQWSPINDSTFHPPLSFRLAMKRCE